jgi:hypothetical protein
MLDVVIRSSKRQDPEQAKDSRAARNRQCDAQAKTPSNGSGTYDATGPSPLELERFKPL